MKKISILILITIGLLSCSDSDQVASDIGKNVVEAFKGKNLDSIIINLERIEEDNEIKFDFSQTNAFNNSIKPLTNGNFKIPIHINRYETEVSGNVPVILEDTEYNIIITDNYDNIYFGMYMNLTYDGVNRMYEDISGNIKMVSENGNNHKYNIHYDHLQSFNNIDKGKTVNVKILLDEFSDGISLNPIRDIINNLNKYKTIEYLQSVSINSKGKNEYSYSKSKNNDLGSDIDFDKALEDYEKFAMDYINMIENSKNNDLSSISDYSELYSKCEAISRNIMTNQDKLTYEQLERFMDLQEDLTEKALDIKY